MHMENTVASFKSRKEAEFTAVQSIRTEPHRTTFTIWVIPKSLKITESTYVRKNITGKHAMNREDGEEMII